MADEPYFPRLSDGSPEFDQYVGNVLNRLNDDRFQTRKHDVLELALRTAYDAGKSDGSK